MYARGNSARDRKCSVHDQKSWDQRVGERYDSGLPQGPALHLMPHTSWVNPWLSRTLVWVSRPGKSLVESDLGMGKALVKLDLGIGKALIESVLSLLIENQKSLVTK